MHSSTSARWFVAGVLSFLLIASPAFAGGFFVGGGYGHHSHCYGHAYSFGFAYTPAPVYVVPAPVYVAPAPVVYYSPPPVVVQQPVVVQPAPVVAAPVQAAQPTFVETGRRYHGHGSNAGRLDWVEGLLNGVPTRIYYDDFGRVHKQKALD